MPLTARPQTRLRLHTVPTADLDAKPRGRCPMVHFILREDGAEREVATYRTDAEVPVLNLPDRSVGVIDADDAISRAMDEEAWLAEMRRVLAPEGTLTFVMPAAGPLAWVDARNLYRYATDILGRGDPPDDPLPTGWNRHYAEADIRGLLERAGLEPVRMERAGIGITEMPQLAGLVVGNFLLGKRGTERKLHPLRERMEAAERRLSVPKVGTQLLVTATRS